MTFDRITKPLTALALCSLLATASLTAPAWAQDEKPAAEKPAAADETAEDQETAAAEGEESEDEDMPPMATVESVPVEEATPPNASFIPPSVSQLQTIDMNKVGVQPAINEAPAAAAQNQKPYVEPVGDTHPALYLTPDKSVIVRLERPAASVLVGNEAHVNVLVDTPTTLVAVPRQSGASYFTVLDAEGRVVMKRHVIVGPAPQYVRIRRSCDLASGPCEDTSVFYCPEGMCHPVTTRQTPGTAPTQPSVISHSATGNAAAMGDTSEYVPEDGDGGGGGGFQYIPFPIPLPFNFPSGEQ